jgi:amino-acid N-acetyltransferase
LKKSPEIKPADEVEFIQVLTMVEDLGLQSEGLRPDMPFLAVAVIDSEIVGCAALEVEDRLGLIRSVGVGLRFQGMGLGNRLVTAVLEHAADIGLKAVYLLTTTAEEYFPRFGFERLAGGPLPAIVTGSAEYSTCVAESATVMRKELNPESADAA